MGVGYPVDLVVCVALGVDMFDCVFPCRTARFGAPPRSRIPNTGSPSECSRETASIGLTTKH